MNFLVKSSKHVFHNKHVDPFLVSYRESCSNYSSTELTPNKPKNDKDKNFKKQIPFLPLQVVLLALPLALLVMKTINSLRNLKGVFLTICHSSRIC